LLGMDMRRLFAFVAEKEQAIARNPQDGRHAIKLRSDPGLSQLQARARMKLGGWILEVSASEAKGRDTRELRIGTQCARSS
jgi:hypothetical protein